MDDLIGIQELLHRTKEKLPCHLPLIHQHCIIMGRLYIWKTRGNSLKRQINPAALIWLLLLEVATRCKMYGFFKLVTKSIYPVLTPSQKGVGWPWPLTNQLCRIWTIYLLMKPSDFYNGRRPQHISESPVRGSADPAAEPKFLRWQRWHYCWLVVAAAVIPGSPSPSKVARGGICQIKHDHCNLSWALLRFPEKRIVLGLRTLSLSGIFTHAVTTRWKTPLPLLRSESTASANSYLS